jgi:hypothetical protein
MSVLAVACCLALGFAIGGAVGIVVGFAWYERKAGLLSDSTGRRAAAIRYEMDDVYGRDGLIGAERRDARYEPAHGRVRRMSA